METKKESKNVSNRGVSWMVAQMNSKEAAMEKKHKKEREKGANSLDTIKRFWAKVRGVMFSVYHKSQLLLRIK